MAVASGHAASSTAEFGQALARLKRRGSNILVVGPSDPGLRKAVSRRLLGDATTGPRRRLFVFTDGGNTYARLGNGPAGPDHVRVVSQPVATRGAVAAGGESADAIPRETVEGGNPSALAWAVTDEIGTFTRVAGGFSPGELRICVDSLGPLVDANDHRTVTRFLSTVTNRVRATGGMAHYHLAVDADDPLIDDLASLFDAIVDLRVRAGRPQQRWALPDRGIESDWLAL